MFLLSSGALMDLLQRHALLSPEQLQQLPALAHGRFCDGRALAKILVHRGWITRYQAQCLVSGRASELTVGKYRILDLLGEGGLSRVFLARDGENTSMVALKVIRRAVLTSQAGRQQFLQEMEAMARLDHPNIVQFLDVDQSGDDFFYAMEYVLGADLHRLVECLGPLPVHLAAGFTRQAALGLQHAHERNLIHRDIKPANLYLTGPEQAGGKPVEANLIKVLDWGLASLRTPDRGTLDDGPSKHIVGTVDFLAPEQALNARQATIRSDIYSLGCALYYLLTGEVPFPKGTLAEKLEKHQKEEAAAVTLYRQDVPPGLAAVLKRMLAKRPEDRYRTPDFVALALAPYARRGESMSGISLDELMRASKLRSSTESPTNWTFGPQADARASQRTMAPQADIYFNLE